MDKLKSWWRRHTVTQDDRRQMVILLVAAAVMLPMAIWFVVFAVITIFTYPFISICAGLTMAIYVWGYLTIAEWVKKGKK